MPPNRKQQRDTNIILALGDWIKNLSPNLARPDRWTKGFIARLIVAATLFVWLLVLILGFFPVYEKQVPQLGLLPLYAFFPGEILSGQPNSNPAFLHSWGIGSGIVFFALVLIAVWSRKRWVAIIFTALFLASLVIVYARVVVQVRHMYMLHQ